MECPICDVPDGARCESEVPACCLSGTHVLRGYINTLCMMGTMRYTYATLAYEYMRIPACAMRMYVSWSLSRAGRVAIASDYAVYEHAHRAGHLILTSIITSLLSRL